MLLLLLLLPACDDVACRCSDVELATANGAAFAAAASNSSNAKTCCQAAAAMLLPV
jgi:hypothetical protein